MRACTPIARMAAKRTSRKKAETCPVYVARRAPSVRAADLYMAAPRIAAVEISSRPRRLGALD